jgi:hypothetical protein
MWWSRKDSARALVRELDLDRGERVLAVARTRGDTVVAATDTALHLPAAEGEHRHRRLPWELIDHARWDSGFLSVRETSGERHRLALSEPGSVPEAVQERITATVVFSSYHRLAARGGVRIVGRRAPAESGAVNWTFVFDSGLDPADPGLRAEAEQRLEDLRRQTGL